MFDKMKKDIENCSDCEKIFGFKPRPIFWGEYNSKIVQVSQAPSNNVNNSGKPFTDLSGKTLRNDLYNITDEEFYNKNNFYITALAHCYPGKDKNGNDRIPPKHCFDKFIKKELELINNRIYIFIGAKSAKMFFPNDPFEELVFKNNIYNNKVAIVLPHPSPLNKKWIKDHPLFLSKRIIEIRKIIKEVIESSNNS